MLRAIGRREGRLGDSARYPSRVNGRCQVAGKNCPLAGVPVRRDTCSSRKNRRCRRRRTLGRWQTCGSGRWAAGKLTLGRLCNSRPFVRAEALAETNRIAKIREFCGDQHPEIEAQAIRHGWEVDKCALEVLRASRPKAPAVHFRDNSVSATTLEAACLLNQTLAMCHL